MKKQETPFEWPFQEYTLKNGVSSNRGISEEAKKCPVAGEECS